jgi:allantoin racemase
MTSPKKLLVVNPNTSQKMTATIAQSVDAAASIFGGFIECTTVCADKGVESVEGAFDEAISTYWTLEKVLPLLDKYDGVLIACFSNHASVKALREATCKPVLHVMEAAILQACPVGAKFSIVTDSDHWRPHLEEGVRDLGAHDKLASVRDAGMTALDTVSLDRTEVVRRLVEASRVAVQDDKAEVILLGCAGMAGLKETISQQLGVPVIDAVMSGVCVVAGLLASGCHTSKRAMYTQLEPRPHEVNVPEPGIMAAYGATRGLPK